MPDDHPGDQVDAAATTGGFILGPSAATRAARRIVLRLAAGRLGCSAGPGPSLYVPDSLDYVLVLGQATPLPAIGVDHPLVCIDVKQSYWSLPGGCLQAELLPYLGRQTGGRTLEVSLMAVDNLDLLDLVGLA